MQKISILSFLFLSLFTGIDKEKSTNIDLEFNINRLEKIRIHNFRGDVRVRAYNGSTLQITGWKKISSKTESGLSEGLAEVKLDTTIIDGEFIVFVSSPDKHFKIDKDGNSHYNSEDWKNWNKNKIKEPNYSYEINLDVKIPANKILFAATHWKDIDIAGMNNDLTVKNHHGNIVVKTNSENLIVDTHHGDIDVENASRSTKKGRFDTHHGDIKTSFAALSAKVFMDTYHGDLYTDFGYDIQPMLLNVNEEKSKKTKYKYKAKNSIKIGNGDGQLEYKTHHGNIYIKKLNNNG